MVATKGAKFTKERTKKENQMKLLLDNMESYEGNAIEIVKQMMGSAMFADNKSIREYMDMVMKNAKVHHDLELNIHGDTDEDLARCLVFQIVEHGMGIIMDENGNGEK